MKLMAPLLIALVSLSTVAQQLPPLDPARQAERDARDRQNGQYQNDGRGDQRQNNGYDNGYGNGYGGGYGRGPRRPRPPMPPPYRPQPPPQYNNDYGPAYTVRWQDYGLTQLPKLVTQDVVIDVRGQYVNEILLRAVSSDVQIQSVLAYLSNGQVIDVRQATGSVRPNQDFRSQIDYRGSVRLERLVIKANSPNLIGSRGQLSVILGLAY